MENPVYKLYADYIHAVDAYYNRQKTGDILGSMLSGRGRYSGCPLHEPFLHDLELAIADLSKNSPTAPLAEEILYFILLTEHVCRDHPAALPLETAEGLALPLLPFLSRDGRENLFTQYRRKLRKHPGLPCQRKVLKSLKASL